VERVPCGELTPFERAKTDGTQSICDSPLAHQAGR
jgi:hypothetical protein